MHNSLGEQLRSLEELSQATPSNTVSFQVVLFLFKLPDESAANRRAAKELVEKWSRPIFDQYRERRDVSDAQERELQLLQVLHAL